MHGIRNVLHNFVTTTGAISSRLLASRQHLDGWFHANRCVGALVDQVGLQERAGGGRANPGNHRTPSLLATSASNAPNS